MNTRLFRASNYLQLWNVHNYKYLAKGLFNFFHSLILSLILATIYCPNGNPSLRLFRMINALSKQVTFLGDFNSKHKQFGCVKPNKSGQTLVDITKELKLFYVNQLGPNRHTQ